MLGRLIGGFVAILVGVSLVKPISNEIKEATTAGTVTGANATVLNLVPGLFALGILLIGLFVTYQALRDAGVIDSNNKQEQGQPKPRRGKQTYADYVKERLNVEEAMKHPFLNWIFKIKW